MPSVCLGAQNNPADQLSVQWLIQANRKENIKAPLYLHFVNAAVILLFNAQAFSYPDVITNIMHFRYHVVISPKLSIWNLCFISQKYFRNWRNFFEITISYIYFIDGR